MEIELLTAAEYVGKESMPLESMRKSLYESEPPSPEFVKWTTMPEMETKENRSTVVIREWGCLGRSRFLADPVLLANSSLVLP